MPRRYAPDMPRGDLRLPAIGAWGPLLDAPLLREAASLLLGSDRAQRSLLAIMRILPQPGEVLPCITNLGILSGWVKKGHPPFRNIFAQHIFPVLFSQG